MILISNNKQDQCVVQPSLLWERKGLLVSCARKLTGQTRTKLMGPYCKV